MNEQPVKVDREVGTASAGEPRPGAAATLLASTARDVEKWRTEARAEADQVIEVAQVEAHRVVASAQKAAEDLLGDARAEADQIKRLAQDHRTQLRELARSVLARVDASSDS